MTLFDLFRACCIAWMALCFLQILFPPGVQFVAPENRPEWNQPRKGTRLVVAVRRIVGR